MRCGVGRSVQRSDGLTLEPPAGHCGLALDRCVGLSGLAVVWLERGARLIAQVLSMPATVPPAPGKEQVVAVMIRAGPHKGSHTAVVIDRAETVLGQVRMRPARPRRNACWPGRSGPGRWRVSAAQGSRWPSNPGQPTALQRPAITCPDLGPCTIVWRMRGEVQQPAAYPEARPHVTAVCKTVGSAGFL